MPFGVPGDLRRELDGLSIAEAEYAVGFRMPMHAHDPAYLGVVVRGTYDERIGSAMHHRRAGAVIFHAPGERHAVRFDGATILRVELNDAWLARARDAAVPVEDSADLPPAERPVAARLRQELRRRDSASTLAIG